MTTYTDDTVSNLVINKLTKAQYEAIQNPSDTELYIVEDAKLSYNELSDKPIIDQTYDGTSANAQSGVAINGAGFLKNYSSDVTSFRIIDKTTSVTDNTGSSTVVIGNYLTTGRGNKTVSIGMGSSAGGNNAVSIGYIGDAYGDYSIALGSNAYANGKSCIQIGKGTNISNASMSVGFVLSDDSLVNYKLLDGTTGLIPDDRISTNIARTSNIPTVDQTYDGTSANAQSGVAIQTKLSSDYYTKAEVDAMLGNIEAILQRLNSGNNS